MNEDAIRQHFNSQADACDRLGSSFTARLCRILGERLDFSTKTGSKVLGWSHDGDADPRADALALRLVGGLHALVLENEDPELAGVYPPIACDDEMLADAVLDAILRQDAMLAAFIDQPPQTNEVARSSMLLPGFLTIARETGRPLQLAEIGSSAGLNLNFDRFHYDYSGASWGDAGSAVRLAPEVRSDTLPLDGRIEIVARAGCDIAPVVISDEAQRSRLRAYIWPDQSRRIARIEAAIGLALETGTRVEQADAADFVKRQLAAREAEMAFVLFHSIMWQYMPARTRNAIDAAMREAGETASASAPIAHLRMEPLSGDARHATLILTIWPGETRHLATCDFHGRWIEWTG